MHIMAKQTQPKPITIAVLVAPPTKEGRLIVVSAAPEGELPVIKTGVFAQLHPLINEVWGELQRREPLLPDPATMTEKPAPVAAKSAQKKDQDAGKDKTEAKTVDANTAPPATEAPVVSKEQMSLFAPSADAVTSPAVVIADPAQDAGAVQDTQDTPAEE